MSCFFSFTGIFQDSRTHGVDQELEILSCCLLLSVFRCLYTSVYEALL